MATSNQMTQFYRNEALSELRERLKIGDGLLDVIELNENQHSAVLAWLFDPREGHGQSDSILKDFLTHVVDQATQRRQAGLALKGDPALGFINKWPVEKLQSSGLGSAFVVTEFSQTVSNRLDLLIVDPVNKYLIAIENKVKTFRQEQLKRYREYVLRLQRKTPWLADLQLAFVALAQDYDPEDEGSLPLKLRNELRHWVPISYDWLKAGAQRAELHLQRGNTGAKLVQDYCQRMTGWENPSDKVCANLVAKLWASHAEACRAISEMGRRPQKSWLLGQTMLESTNESAQLFAAQNQAVVLALREGQGFASVRKALLASNELFTVDLVDWGRSWINIMPRGARPLYSKDESEYFPVYLNAYRLSDGASRVRLVFQPASVVGAVPASKVRALLAGYKPEIAKMQNFSRRIILKESIPNDELPGFMAKQEQLLTNMLGTLQ